MHAFNQLHKLFTYTDRTLIEYTPKEVLVYVYAQADLSEEIETLRNYPRDEVTPHAIQIEIRFPINRAAKETTEQILAGAEALAQVAAISPDFFNIFGTKKGVNITDLLLVVSQPILKRFAEFATDKNELGSVCGQSLRLSSVYFYGAATRSVKEGESDWVKPFLRGKEPFSFYETSIQNVFDTFCIDHKRGKFFVTRVAIEDFLSLPHRFIEVDSVTRPFRAVRGVFGQNFEAPIPGSPLDQYERYDELGRCKKVLLAPGQWRLQLHIVEEEILGELVNVVIKMPPYSTKEEKEEYRVSGTDQFINSEKIRNYTKEKQKIASEGKLG